MSKFEAISLTQNSANYSPVIPCGPGEDGLHLYVSNDRVTELPEEGEITFRFRRGPITVVEALRGQSGRASVDLSLKEICGVKAEKNESEYSNESNGVLDDLFEKAKAENASEE